MIWQKSTEAKSIRYLIKLKIVKVVTNLEIIQPQLGNYSTTVFDRPTLFSFEKRKLKKSKIGNPFSPSPLKCENDVSRDNQFLILTMW